MVRKDLSPLELILKLEQKLGTKSLMQGLNQFKEINSLLNLKNSVGELTMNFLISIEKVAYLTEFKGEKPYQLIILYGPSSERVLYDSRENGMIDCDCFEKIKRMDTELTSSYLLKVECMENYSLLEKYIA